ncbi:alkaline phosphatase family protein [Caulobacter endophyticus]|uniref:alkaline phosphatase family protein n=1 Tax=Caulobacter endophyticus TaxID=2172652 RepID=UPI00240F2A2C|nr:alkaline phosphatase family protein [Caulobacter endophyticus]MDG2528305.1 alkaline phosphatase family protein [Caulobacter endophyticus]
MSMENIEHVVVLMLENRSFDSMLGWLYEHEDPEHFVPATTDRRYRGLQDVDLGKFVNAAQLIGRFQARPKRGASGFTVPTFAPGEDFDHVLRQFYGPGAKVGQEPDMKGVLADFADIVGPQLISLIGVPPGEILKLRARMQAQSATIMESYTPAQAPVLNQLARHYAVSDAWHASVPSQTNPNRAFLMCGTSNGMTDNGDLETSPEAKAVEKILKMAIGDDRVEAPTIFNALHEAGVDWTVFYQTGYLPPKIAPLLANLDTILKVLGALPLPGHRAARIALNLLRPHIPYLTSLSSGDVESCYTWRLFPHIKDGIPGAKDRFQKLASFHQQARAGTLPRFSYIEPAWSVAHSTTDSGPLKNLFTALGDDYHPPGSVLVGEQFVKEVYTSLIANEEAWKKTLLLITFDEFVGSFDHQTADLRPGVVKPPWPPGRHPPHQNRHGFQFDRLGARVPTIVVSPWVQRGTVFRSPTETPFDHTSVIRTTLEAIDRPDLVERFGERTKAAPSFADALTLDRPRTDARALAFLDVARKVGEPVGYGQTFVLRNSSGQYLAPLQPAMKVAGDGKLLPGDLMDAAVDLGIAALFPVLGQEKALLSFVAREADPPTRIAHGARGMLVTRESRAGSLNALGAWSDCWDCYYDKEYAWGDAISRQTWVIQKLDHTDQPLRYGDRIYLKNARYPVRGWLAHDRRRDRGKWLTTNAKGDVWTIEPAPARV